MRNLAKSRPLSHRECELSHPGTYGGGAAPPAGGGWVTLTPKPKVDFTSNKIEPDVINENDQDMLQDLIVAAINEALKQGQKLMNDEVSKLAGGLGLPPDLL